MLVACNRKRGRSSQPLPPPTPTPASSSFFLIYRHEYSQPYSYSVHALEITAAAIDNEHSKTLPEPLFRCNRKAFPDSPDFVALDSKIYIIGGISAFGPGKCKDRYVLDTYVFDTTKPLSPHSKDDDPIDFLIKGPQLNAPKLDPILVTFEGRIYAFPRWFSHHSPTNPKCEVLNLEVGSWVPLPDPPLLDECEKNLPRKKYCVQAYFVNDSIFFASTPKGIYCLNLANPIEWKHVQLLGGVSRLP
ncbi:hypothetical protein REPUB_Repub02eG0199900 [Reevesia pubescens]